MRGGAHTWYLAREGFDTYAFDGSESAVKKVRARLDRDNLNASLKVLDGVEIDYKNDYFDAVIDNVSIYCSTISNITSMYEQIYRVLKVGGNLFTTAFTVKTTGAGTGKEIEYNTYTDIEMGNLAGRGTTHFWGEDELEKILKGIGFKLLYVNFMDYDDMGNKVSMIMIQAQK